MTVFYSDFIKKQLKKLDKPVAKKIVDYMDGIEKLEDPRSKGKPLVANLKGLWRYRIGDMRVICRIKEAELIVEALRLGDRKDVYE